MAEPKHFYPTVGGTPIESRLTYGRSSPTIWNFGYISEDDRTTEQKNEVSLYKSQQKPIILGNFKARERAKGWTAAYALNGGQQPLPAWQQTGSCTGASWGNLLIYHMGVEIAFQKQVEKSIFPFWLLTYGRGRLRAGMRGRGEGGIPTYLMQAVREDGVLPYDYENLPKPEINPTKGIRYTVQEEMYYSDGSVFSEDVLKDSSKHIVLNTPVIKSTDELRDLLLNNRFAITASDWGGELKCKVVSDPPVLLNRRQREPWQHQQFVIDFWDHPKLGELFAVFNNWSLDVHGFCPSGLPHGAYWTLKNDMAYMISHNDTYAVDTFEEGFDASELPPEFYF